MAMEILQLQEDIKQADLDQSIRQSKPSELRCLIIPSKVYVKELKKWLYSVQGLTKETVEKRLSASIDVAMVLDAINVKDASDGVKKLFKILRTNLKIEVLEVMVIKITELETIKLLKYDDLYSSLKADKGSLRSKISSLSQGWSL